MAKKLLFPSTVVGSLPRPLFVRDIILNDGDPFSPVMDKAVLYAIAMQEQAGLDIISDGEWRRKSYVGVIANVASGFKHFFNKETGQSWHTVVGKLKHDRPGFFAKEVAFVKKHSKKQVKVAMPSPYLLGTRLWDEKESIKAYKTRRDFMEALVPILRKEIELLKKAGADVVQIDDPHICLFVDEVVRKQFKDPDAELRMAVELVNDVVKGVKGIETALHLCRRNKARKGWSGKGGYEAIIPFIKDLKVDQLALEYTIPVAGDVRALRALPERFKIALGCVDVRFDHIDTPEEIASRVEKALEVIAPERILLNPDCGFAPGSQANIPIDESYQKLKNEAEAAKLLRNKYAA